MPNLFKARGANVRSASRFNMNGQNTKRSPRARKNWDSRGSGPCQQLLPRPFQPGSSSSAGSGCQDPQPHVEELKQCCFWCCRRFAGSVAGSVVPRLVATANAAAIVFCLPLVVVVVVVVVAASVLLHLVASGV